VWEWDVEEIAHQWSLLSSKARDDLSQTVYVKKNELLEIGKKASKELYEQDIKFVPFGHESYPPALHRLSHPPRWIFVQGNMQTLHSASIAAVVGTRKPSLAGCVLAYRCAKELVTYNLIVLSGLAEGIDEQAHLGAVDHYGQSIAVLGHGLNAEQAASRQALQTKILVTDGAIISEYLPNDFPSRQNFLRRNELQAALAKVVVPIESPSLQSGTGATIRRAMHLGTPVVGVIPAHVSEKSLLDTKTVLSELGHPVFTVLNSNSHDFWNKLKEIFPAHNWEMNPQTRQDRFFRIVEHQILDARKKVQLDDKSIDRFAEYLKQRLKEEKP
jgi:DNA processing protein